MRADARANRERVLEAAEQVFGEFGAHASTEEVARRAGVGIATVFRHFPTKRHLIEAALVRHFEEITRRAVELHAAPDAAGALRDLVATMVTTGATKVTLANLLDADGGFSPAAQQGVRGAAVGGRRGVGPGPGAGWCPGRRHPGRAVLPDPRAVPGGGHPEGPAADGA